VRWVVTRFNIRWLGTLLRRGWPMAFSSSDYHRERITAQAFARPLLIAALGRQLTRSSSLLRRAFEQLTLKVLLRLDAEPAHDATLQLIKYSSSLFPKAAEDDETLAQHLFGLTFKNPIGAAAGLDKDAEIFSYLQKKHGFGFVEVGTVTPRPQKGNEKPRAFRLTEDAAIINRFGFNSDGQDVVLRRLAVRAPNGAPIGVNIGTNKNSTDRIGDYVTLIEAFAPVADYFTVNISSPNTPGLRDLQKASALDDLLARVLEARDRSAARTKPTPLLLKIAPDLSLGDLDDVVSIARKRDIDGMIVGNTTVMRPPSLRDTARAIEQGGLSGRPLFRLATRMLAETYVRVEGQFPLIGVGGIDSGAAALAKIKAGASLVQLYTGLVFRGLSLVSDIKADLVNLLRLGRYEQLADAVGLDAATMTAEPWPQ
jgi:dihydroorotate dehydrogenase